MSGSRPPRRHLSAPNPGAPVAPDALAAHALRGPAPGRPGALVAGPGYEVGYAKPPLSGQFRKGPSGNPRGRPKGAKNKLPALNEERMKQIILEEAYRPIRVRDGARAVTVPIARAVLRSLAVNAVKGHHRAQRLFAELLSGTETSNKALHDAWVTTALDYKIAWDKELQRRTRMGITHLAPPVPHPDHVRFDVNRQTMVINGPRTRDETEIYDKIYADLRRQVMLREMCRETFQTEDDPDEKADLARHLAIADTTIAHYRTVLPQALYPVPIDRRLRTEMRAQQKVWLTITAAQELEAGGLKKDCAAADGDGDGEVDRV